MANSPQIMPSNDNDKTIPFLRFNKFNLLLKIFIALIIALLIFQLGMFVGFRKANYAFGWGDNYHRIFGGPRGGILRDFSGNDFVNGHGIAGTITKIDGETIIVTGNKNIEKAIICDDETLISAGRSTITLDNLKSGDKVTVIGKPNNDGTITAGIIRLFGQAFDIPDPRPERKPFFMFKR